MINTERWRGRLGRGLVLAGALLSLCGTAYGGPVYKVLRHLASSDGAGPWGGMTLDTNGNLLGAAAAGGGSGCYGYGCGTIFELTPAAEGNWRFSVLYDFVSEEDGAGPYGKPTLGTSGNIYGTTTSGPHYPGGAVFELTLGFTGWNETLLHAFCPTQECKDGGVPIAGVITDGSGNLYGTTAGGGPHGGGVVFQLARGPDGWKETVIHGFYPSYYNQPAPKGTGPYAGLIMDSSGNLYGTTREGGALCNGWSCGVVYQLTPRPDGHWKEIVLHRFHGKDGATPGWGSLLMDSSGSLYGTTLIGGCCGGVVFKLTLQPDGHWKERILYEFKGGAKGYLPNAGVVMDQAGNLYGITDAGGYGDCGVIYKLVPQPTGKWAYTVLHTFGQGTDGCMPEGNLAIDQSGNLYGGTVLGGAYGAGVVFQLTP